jgi:hypothetical protein
MGIAPIPRIVLAILPVIFLCAPGIAVGSEDDTNLSRHITEFQAGGGIAAVSADGIGPMAHVQARFALWRTIGLGVYAGGIYTGGDGVRGVVPVCGRLNLSLPFWRSFEPVFSIGVGDYIYFVRRYGGGTKSEGQAGFHAALALLFPHKKHGFGVEGSLHVTADPSSSDDFNVISGAVGTMLFR